MAKKTESKDLVVVETPAGLFSAKCFVRLGGEYLVPIHTFATEDPKVDLVYDNVKLLDYKVLIRQNVKGPLYLFKHECPLNDNQSAKDQQVIYFLLDNCSSVEVDDPNYFRLAYDLKTDVVLLLGSTSVNDRFSDRVIFNNITSKDGSYTSSTIDNHLRYGEIPPKLKLEKVFARDLMFIGNSLPSGFYSASEIRWCVFPEDENKSGSVNINTSSLAHCRFSSKQIKIVDSFIESCTFRVPGLVSLKKCFLNMKAFNEPVPSIMYETIFDYTEIDIAARLKAFMVRIDKDRVVIVLPGSDGFEDRITTGKQLLTMSFRHPNSRRNFRHRAMDALFGDLGPSEIEESVIDYLVDTIFSRIKMMSLLDDARRLLENNLLSVKPVKDRPDHLKELRNPFKAKGRPWNLPPLPDDLDKTEPEDKETENTIYIDEVSKF